MARTLATTLGSTPGWRARNSGSVSGFSVASVSATKISGSSVGNRGEVWPSRSVADPSGSRNFTAMPRMSGFVSERLALPAAFDQRTVTSCGCPSKWPARHSAVASGVAVKVPV